MDARELRIGNLLTCESGIREVCRIDVDGCVTSQVGEAMKYDGRPTTLEPIPLTEKWLMRLGITSFGFIYLDDNVGGMYYNSFDGCFYIYSSMGDPSSYGFKKDCKYVHQLQNLYFALTGKELELK